MKKMYRVLGKRGRITIPYEIRQSVGFGCDDVLSFEQQDHDTVLIKREKICNDCKDERDVEENEMTLFDFLNNLSDMQQRAAIVHLSANVGKGNRQKADRKGGMENEQ